ncbi:hypothetical protein [Tomitella gaofuii]|uniref:hypothetical protein n=1 Tax=Tomitella gaofuii TaxID=2760083 RepID=UPI0015F893C2|nr:hypothetical protein [Tomitella gaofuii]
MAAARRTHRRTTTCGRCEAPIVWVTTASRGTRLALDASPDDHGVFQVVTGGADGLIGRPLAGSGLAAAIADGTPLFIPHRRTCTANKSHNPMPDDVRAEIARALGRATSGETP